MKHYYSLYKDTFGKICGLEFEFNHLAQAYAEVNEQVYYESQDEWDNIKDSTIEKAVNAYMSKKKKHIEI